MRGGQHELGASAVTLAEQAPTSKASSDSKPRTTWIGLYALPSASTRNHSHSNMRGFEPQAQRKDARPGAAPMCEPALVAHAVRSQGGLQPLHSAVRPFVIAFPS
jgi:hypothetical protein